MLASWRTRYRLLGRDLDITPGSDAFNEADALSYELATTELGAQQAAHRVLLRYQTGEDLDASAFDEGTGRLHASAARRVVRVSGPSSATVPVSGATLGSAGGQRFAPINATTGEPLLAIETDGAGSAEITTECTTAGTGGNLGLASILTWSSAPTGFSSLGTVVEGVAAVDGEEAESDAALRQRLLGLRRARPASGAPAHWRSWALEVGGVGDCFVHAAALPPDEAAAPARSLITPDTLGCVTLLPLTPAPAADTYVQAADGTLGAGLDPSYSRVPSDALCGRVNDYITGAVDRDGRPVAEAARVQLYPGPMARENWGAVPAHPSPTDVIIGVRVNPDPGAWVFVAPKAIQAGSTTTSLHLDNASNITTGHVLGVTLPAGHIRGNVFLTRVTAPAVGSTVTVSPALPVNPVPGALVYFDPGIWSDVRALALRYFDGLGPGTVAGRSQRFPPISWGATDRFSPSQLLARVAVLPALVDAQVLSPLAASTAVLGFLATPGTITVTRIP